MPGTGERLLEIFKRETQPLRYVQRILKNIGQLYQVCRLQPVLIFLFRNLPCLYSVNYYLFGRLLF